VRVETAPHRLTRAFRRRGMVCFYHGCQRNRQQDTLTIW
jgi:hypothetical protein